MEYFEGLGKIVANLQSLEFVLRSFLLNSEIATGRSFPESKKLYDMNVDDTVSLNAFTNYDTLRQLISKYNNHPKISSENLTVDESLVEIRDALAHGRVSAPVPSPDLRLLKFDKPQNNQVKVTFSVVITKEWFDEQRERVCSAVLKVNEANNKLRSGEL